MTLYSFSKFLKMTYLKHKCRSYLEYCHKNYYCSEIVELFHLLKLESLVRKLKFSDVEFALIVKKAKALLKKINTV